MGLFNWANMKYPTDGKGVEKPEKKENPVKIFFGVIGRKFWKFVSLDLVYFITASPTWIFMYICGISFLQFHNGNGNYNQMLPYLLVLIPLVVFISSPATMGATYIFRNFAREQHAWVPTDMFDKASKNYKQSMAIGLINSVVAFALLYGYFYYSLQSGAASYLKYVVLLLGALFLMMRNYVYPLAVSYKLGIGTIYRYAMAMTIMKLPQNVLLTGACLGLIYLCFSYQVVGVLLSAVFLLAFLGFLTTFYCDRVILDNMLDENKKQYEEKKLRPYS